jgi:hypothetical protein
MLTFGLSDSTGLLMSIAIGKSPPPEGLGQNDGAQTTTRRRWGDRVEAKRPPAFLVTNVYLDAAGFVT